MDHADLPEHKAFATQVSIREMVTFRLHELDSIPIGDFPKRFYDLIVDPIDKVVIEYTLKRHKGNQVHTAKTLGLNRNTLRKRMIIHGLMPTHQETTHQ